MIHYKIYYNKPYTYDATGIKLKKEISGSSQGTTEYVGGYVYENNTLNFIPHAEGYIDMTSAAKDYIFQYKDHLGNIRLSYKKGEGNTPEIISENNYYPFGLGLIRGITGW